MTSYTWFHLLISLTILGSSLSTFRVPKSEHGRFRRWIDLGKKGIPPKDPAKPSKVFCGSNSSSEGSLPSPVALGARAHVRRRKGESLEDAIQREAGSSEDQSILNPKSQTIRFNKRYCKIRDLLFYQNNGETVTFQFSETETSDASFRGEGWDDEYIFAKGHFQWLGENLNKAGGAGHSVNGKSYPVEMELVHYRSSDNSLEEAWEKGGVFIISVLMQLVSRGVPALTPLLSNIPYVAQPGPLKLLHAPVNFSQLIPSGDAYFIYDGSYTFSPCKAARRLVFRTPIEIDDEQMSFFQFLIYDDKTPMINNFQPLQPLNSRPVTYYREGYKISTREKLKESEKKSHKHGQLKRRKFVPSGE